MDYEDLHPSQVELLRFFEYEHLAPELAAISEPFHTLAIHLVTLPVAGAELTTALRKLLEAKDCAVRAALHKRWLDS